MTNGNMLYISASAAGWSREARLMVADLWEQKRKGHLISQDQLQAYEKEFHFSPTSSNLKQVEHVIFVAREAACREPNARIERQDDDPRHWAEAALRETGPLVFEKSAS